MFRLGVGPTWNGDTMTDKDTSQGDESEDDDWMSYANAGFGTTDYHCGMMVVKKQNLLSNPIGMRKIYN